MTGCDLTINDMYSLGNMQAFPWLQDLPGGLGLPLTWFCMLLHEILQCYVAFQPTNTGRMNTHLSVLSALPKCLAAHSECLPPFLASSAGFLNSFVSEQSRPSLHMITCAMILKCSRKCTSWAELRWGGHWRGSQRKAIYFYCSRSWPVDIAREDRQSSFHKMFLTSRWRSRSLWDQAIWHVRILATNSQIYTKSCCFLLSFFFLIENVG
jgi:hypothetical protein